MQLEAEPAPLAALAQQLEVAAVGVDVHQVRVERADAQDVSHGRSPPAAATCSGVSGMWRSSSASRPCAAASSARPPGVTSAERDQVVGRDPLAVRADARGGRARSGPRSPSTRIGDRLRDVGPAVVWRRGRAAGAAGRRRRARARWRSRARRGRRASARGGRRRRSRRARAAAGSSASGRRSGRPGSASVKSAASAASVLIVHAGRLRSLEHCEQLGVEVERGHVVARAWRAAARRGRCRRRRPGRRRAPRSRAPPTAAGRRRSRRTRRRARPRARRHRQYASAWPRRVSSSRSSSSAV